MSIHAKILRLTNALHTNILLNNIRIERIFESSEYHNSVSHTSGMQHLKLYKIANVKDVGADANPPDRPYSSLMV